MKSHERDDIEQNRDCIMLYGLQKTYTCVILRSQNVTRVTVKPAIAIMCLTCIQIACIMMLRITYIRAFLRQLHVKYLCLYMKKT